jgi:hypothetical protein
MGGRTQAIPTATAPAGGTEQPGATAATEVFEKSGHARRQRPCTAPLSGMLRVRGVNNL